MPSPRVRPELTEEAWMEQLAATRAEVQLPGYWANIADNCSHWAEELSVGVFWSAAKGRLNEWRDEYRRAYSADLLASPGLPSFVGKPEESIRDKLYRRCKQEGAYIAKAIATEGAPIPRIGDLVRTRIACRYIDGVEFLATKLIALANEMNLSPRRRREGRIEGYFAQHLTLEQEAIFRLGGVSQLCRVMCEIQVASELATRMWDASHPLYARVRSDGVDPERWQWDPSDPRFIANQLGHMIHLADGLLVQLRKSIL